MLIPSNRTKRECILSRLCFLVLSVWVSLPSAAQNNPYKIDDALYPIYQRASKQARQQEGLLVGDKICNFITYWFTVTYNVYQRAVLNLVSFWYHYITFVIISLNFISYIFLLYF